MHHRHVIAENSWITVRKLEERDLYHALRKTLDRGEAEAIALARQLAANVLLIDETDGRREAENQGLVVTGLVGILLEAKSTGLIPLVRPEIERLVSEADFWLSPRFIDEALALAGER